MDLKAKAVITIVHTEDNNVVVYGPLSETLYTYGLLQCAIESVRRHHEKDSKRSSEIPTFDELVEVIKKFNKSTDMGVCEKNTAPD